MQYLYSDEDFGFEVYADEYKYLYYSNGCELIKFAHVTILLPSGYYEVYMNGEFQVFDDLATLAYKFMRSEDMEW